MAVTDDLRAEFAFSGVLRVALNHGNRVLVSRDKDGTALGITVDLSNVLAETLNLSLQFVHYERAGDVSRDAMKNAYDVCFLAVDPDRAKTIIFTDPYVQIEGKYLAAPSCEVADAEALVHEAIKVGTVEGSAYTLDLARKNGAENLVYFSELQVALAAMDEGGVAAIAGIGSVMGLEAAKRPGARVLDPPFMVIRQAIGMPVGRPAASVYLTKFVSEMVRSGCVGKILERHGVSADCVVKPSGIN